MFSASNNAPDEEDPYGFDIDFNKKLTSKKSFDMDMDFSDDEEEDDPAKKFKDKKKKGKEKEKRKEVKSGSALDRASAYLSKYKGPAAKSKEVSVKVHVKVLVKVQPRFSKLPLALNHYHNTHP